MPRTRRVNTVIDQRADFPSAVGNDVVRESKPRRSVSRFHTREDQVQGTEFADSIVHLTMHRHLIKCRTYFSNFHGPTPLSFITFSRSVQIR